MKSEDRQAQLRNLLDETYEMVGLIELSIRRDVIPQEIVAVLEKKALGIAAKVRELPAGQSAEDGKEWITDSVPEDSDPQEFFPEEECVEDTEESDKEDLHTSDEEEISAHREQYEEETPKRLNESRVRPIFTLNDKFLFTRELFGGDRQAFDSSLTKVAGMDRREDMEDYFLYELGWDRHNPEVKRFLSIVSALF